MSYCSVGSSLDVEQNSMSCQHNYTQLGKLFKYFDGMKTFSPNHFKYIHMYIYKAKNKY